MTQAKKDLQDIIFTTYIYEIIKAETEGMDSVYGDYIEKLVGEYGLYVLLANNHLESCGVVNGRQLYVLC